MRYVSPLAQSGPKKPGKQWQCPATHSPFPLQSDEQPSIESAKTKDPNQHLESKKARHNYKNEKIFHEQLHKTSVALLKVRRDKQWMAPQTQGLY